MKADELARIWPERWPRPGEESNTQNGLMVRKFGAAFEGRELDSITRPEAREWALANLGTARYVRAMFNDAVRDGLIEENVFAELGLPVPGQEPVNVPPTEKVNELVIAAAAQENFALSSRISFAAYVGLRSGEQRAVLKPGDGGMGNAFIDTVGQRVQVGTSLPIRRLAIDWQLGRNGSLRRPKTKRSIRRVLVPDIARRAVNTAVHHHNGRSAYLWTGGTRKAREEWTELRREVGFYCKWHDLRHHAATWLLDHGATVDDVAVQLGVDPALIRDTYGHADAELALARLEDLVDV